VLKPTLENLRTRIQSFTGRDDWQLAVYAAEPDCDDAGLNCLEAIGDVPHPIVELVANSASVVRTTLVADIAELGSALEKSPKAADHLPPKLRKRFEQGFADAGGTAIAAPCFDPWQVITNDQNDRWVIGVLTVWGNLALEEVVGNADLRYLIEQYAMTVASVLRPKRIRPKAWQNSLHSLYEIQLFPRLSDGLRIEADSVGKVAEPLKTPGEQWVQFGPGLAISKAGWDAFQRGRTRLRADVQYVKESV
jgi:hypothetical protein